jgi:CYTH domain-containing protein
MEIERKFLIKELPIIKNYKHKKIIQGYISIDPVIRMRQIADSYFLTVKSHGHMVREELELPLTADQFSSLWSKLECPPIEKTRYFIPLENHLIAELDIYEASLEGLITIEVEFCSEEEALSFMPPSWFGKDVTHDSRYKNNHLSLHGSPS